MADQAVAGYADALLAVASAEGAQAGVEDELFRFAQALRGNDELQSALSDADIPVERRVQIVEDLLGGKAAPTTASLVSMVVGAGRGNDLAEIIDAAIDRGAATRDRGVARVRSAVELSDDQKNRLAAAIKKATGNEVEVRVIIDPSVMGGAVTEIGDDVIDGSVRRRLNQMKASLG